MGEAFGRALLSRLGGHDPGTGTVVSFIFTSDLYFYYNRLVQNVFTCMGASNAIKKFGAQTTTPTGVTSTIVVVIVMTPKANPKSSSSIFLLRINSKNYSLASNISRQSGTNASALPRIRILCVVSISSHNQTVLFNTTTEQIFVYRCLRLSLVDRVIGTCRVRKADPDGATYML